MHADEAEAAKQRAVRRQSNAACTRQAHRLDYLKNPIATLRKLCDFQDALIDPYVKVAIMPWQIFGQTRHVEDHKDGEDLRWDEQIILEYPLDPMHDHDCTVVVQAWDDDVGVDDLIGQGFIEPEDIKKIFENKNVMQKIKCELADHQDESAGAVFLEVIWCPHAEPDHNAEKHVKWHKGGPTLGDFKILVTKAVDLRNPAKEVNTADGDKKLQLYAALIAVGYFGTGAIVFNINCLTDGSSWTFIDTLYFGIVTITTTGYGDLLPNSNYCNNGTMVFSSFYAFIGVGLIASLMGFIVGSILEKRHTMAFFVDATKGAPPKADAKKALEEKEVKIDSWNPIEHIPYKFRAMVKAFGYWALLKIIVVVYFCYNDSRPIDIDADLDAWGGAPNMTAFALAHADNESHTGFDAAHGGELHTAIHAAHAAYSPPDDDSVWNYCASSPDPACSNYCTETDYSACTDGSCDECVANVKCNFLTPLDSVYMVSVSMTSVGYGDFYPVSQSAKGFAIFWLLIGTLFVGKAFGAAADHFLQYHQDKLNAKNVTKEYDHKQIMKLDENASGEIDEVEFVTHMLVKSIGVDVLILNDLRARFKELDKSGDGFIGEEDLVEDDM